MVREVREFARNQRRSPTSAEDILWQVLRGRKHLGLKFKRQEPVGPYTVDFLCFERKLIIEVDGIGHDSRKAYDRARSHEIEQMGFSVIRFRNEHVLGDLDAVLEAIGAAACIFPTDLVDGGARTSLTPSPSPHRERGERPQ